MQAYVNAELQAMRNLLVLVATSLIRTHLMSAPAGWVAVTLPAGRLGP
jgi:hypothetical protein